jgi:K+ transporter
VKEILLSMFAILLAVIDLVAIVFLMIASTYIFNGVWLLIPIAIIIIMITIVQDTLQSALNEIEEK